MVQTIQDLRDKHTLDWNTAIVLYENNAISDEILNDIKETLSQKASVSTFEMGSNPAQSLPSILASLPSRQLGKYFLPKSNIIKITVIRVVEFLRQG